MKTLRSDGRKRHPFSLLFFFSFSPFSAQEIAAMIATEFAKQTSLDAVAQAVVDRVKRIHCDTFASGGERSKFCPRHEDMTLLVRNFGYPLGEMSQPTLTPTQGTLGGG